MPNRTQTTTIHVKVSAVRDVRRIAGLKKVAIGSIVERGIEAEVKRMLKRDPKLRRIVEALREFDGEKMEEG